MSEKFHWGLSGLNKPRFVAFTNLLSLRNGGQLDPPPSEDPHDEWNQEDSDHGSTVDTYRADRLSYSGHEDLKKCFLDGLAELVACKKAPTHVACAIMQEGEDRVRIWVARNEGFMERDDAFFRKFESLLGRIASSQTGMLSTDCA